MNSYELILASASPRRKALLEQAGYAFRVIVSDADESAPAHMTPVEIAEHNATLKAMAIIDSCPENALIIGADTIVTIDGAVFGKPSNADEARATLETLSGRTHQVITGVCLAGKDVWQPFSETTDVIFKELSPEEIEAYIATGEPLDKAGAYGIQGKGGAMVDHIDGDYENVVGLPVAKLAQYLAQLGIRPSASL